MFIEDFVLYVVLLHNYGMPKRGHDNFIIFENLIKICNQAKNALSAELSEERERWFLWTPVFIAIGIGAYFSLPFEPSRWWFFVALLPIISIYFWGTRAPIVVFCLVLIGFAAGQIRTHSLKTVMLERSTGIASFNGRVVSQEYLTDGVRVILERIRVSFLDERKTPNNIRLKLRGDNPAISPGDWIEGRAIISPPSPPAMPGGFDFQRHMYFKGIGGLGYNIGPVKITSIAERESFSNWIEKLRQSISDRVYNALGPRTGGTAVALMTGMRGLISSETMDAIRNSGLAHLLAISGLHIGLVSGILFISTRGILSLIPSLALNQPIKKWTAVIALIGAFCYAMISGGSIPTQRAFLMVSIVLFAVMMDRRGISMRLVAWAATVILIVQPESLLSASFQMSFSAVVALIAAYEYLRKRRLKLKTYNPNWIGKRFWIYVAGVMLTTFIAGTATAPAAIFHFNQFVSYGLVANLVAVPITAMWIMPWAILALLLMPFGLEPLALTPMGWGLEVVLKVSESVETWPGAVSLLPSMPVWGILLISFGALWVSIWQKPKRLYGVIGIMVGASSLYFVEPPDLIIDGRGRVFAARTNEGTLALSSVRQAKFETGIWLRQDGNYRPKSDWGKGWSFYDSKNETDTEAGDGGRTLTCDINGCLYQGNGQVVALVNRLAALTEDCWSTDFVVSLEPIRKSCPSKSGNIDWFDLWREGTHALWLKPDKITVKTVNGERGNRPWVVRNKSRKKKNNNSENSSNIGGAIQPVGPAL